MTGLGLGVGIGLGGCRRPSASGLPEPLVSSLAPAHDLSGSFTVIFRSTIPSRWGKFEAFGHGVEGSDQYTGFTTTGIITIGRGPGTFCQGGDFTLDFKDDTPHTVTFGCDGTHPAYFRVDGLPGGYTAFQTNDPGTATVHSAARLAGTAHSYRLFEYLDPVADLATIQALEAQA